MGSELCCQKSEDNGKYRQNLSPVPLSRTNNSIIVTPLTSNNNKIDEINLIDSLLDHLNINVQDKQYTANDFQKVSQIGEGGFAIVYLVELKEEAKKGISKKYAMKKIHKKKLFERRVVENLKLQKKVLAELKSNFTIQLKYSFQDKSNVYFIMQYASGGDLYSFLENRKVPRKVEEFRKLGQKASRFIIACVILALEVLHKKNIMYRDLKPQNVLVFQNGYVKLADFGLAKKIQGQQISKTMAGTRIYFAPQIVQRKGYNKNVDLWTLGIFLYELIIHRPPFDHKEIIKNKFSMICRNYENNRNWQGVPISQQAKNLINAFLKVDPSQRLGVRGFDQIKNHEFFTKSNFDWGKLQRLEMESPLRDIVRNNAMKYNQIIEVQEQNDEISYDKIEDLTYRERGLKG